MILVTFSRTKRCSFEWCDKASVTDILLDGKVVGTIKGWDVGLYGSMDYCVKIGKHLSFADSLSRAKIEVRQIFRRKA